MSAIHGRDDGDLRKYRTEIPNIVFTLGLDPYALALYCHIKRTTGAADGGKCWKSTRTLAEETGMSVGKVSEARAELEREREELGGKSLITVHRPKNRKETTTVVCNDVWPENFGVFTTRTQVCSPHERKKEPVVEEEDVEESNDSSSDEGTSPQSVSLEKYIVDRIYRTMREAKLRLPNDDFGYHLGRAQDMLAKDDPTDEEIDDLPDAFLRLFTIKGVADAQSALIHMRRQKMRGELLSGQDKPAPVRKINPQPQREWERPMTDERAKRIRRAMGMDVPGEDGSEVAS